MVRGIFIAIIARQYQPVSPRHRARRKNLSRAPLTVVGRRRRAASGSVGAVAQTRRIGSTAMQRIILAQQRPLLTTRARATHSLSQGSDSEQRARALGAAAGRRDHLGVCARGVCLVDKLEDLVRHRVTLAVDVGRLEPRAVERAVERGLCAPGARARARAAERAGAGAAAPAGAAPARAGARTARRGACARTCEVRSLGGPAARSSMKCTA